MQDVVIPMNDAITGTPFVTGGIGRKDALASWLIRAFTRFAPPMYHLWYYHTYIQRRTSWLGVPTLKSPSDMWNYQEILVSLKPSVVFEFGTCRGGSALFFASVMRQIGQPFKLISVDIDHSLVSPLAKNDPDIELLTMSSTDGRVSSRLLEARKQHPGPAFTILDSDHSKTHVLAEMLSLRDVLTSGDYLIVEDSNVNGHPVHPTHGAGPHEAMQEYFRQFSNDYRRDREHEKKFGFTFATDGFLIRN
jgi:cephalosporin hydroxylase